MTSPEQLIADARASAAQIYAAAQVRPTATVTVSDMVTSAAQMSQTAVDRATDRVTLLWRDVDPYDGEQVEAFTKSAAQVTVAVQQRVALIHVESQVQQLKSMGVDVQVTPVVPDDVRLASRASVVTADIDVDGAPAVTVEYADSDAGAVSVTVDAEDSTTEQVFNRPARAYRYQRSVGADEQTAQAAAESRIVRIVDGNAILAQRMAEEQVLQAAVDLDAPVIGWRRIIHPEIVTKTGVCGLCVAAATRMYSLEDLKPLHGSCNCTVAAVTEDEDPGLDLNEEDFATLYAAAGEASGKDRSTWAADLKKIRYRTDEHGELGLVLKPMPGESVQHFVSEASPDRTEPGVDTNARQAPPDMSGIDEAVRTFIDVNETSNPLLSGATDERVDALGLSPVELKRADLVARNEKILRDLAPTPEERTELVSRSHEGLRLFAADKDVAVNVPSEDILGKILDDGQLRSQRDPSITETGGGGYVPEERELYETVWFGEHDVPPIYGYLRDRSGKESGADDYGDIALVLNAAAKESTTVVVGDSLDDRIYAFPGSLNNPGRYTANPTEAAEHATAQGYADYLNGVGVEADPDDFFASAGFYADNHVEAQIHNGVTVDDVAFIHFKGDPPSEAMIERLAAEGISYTVAEEG